MKLTIYTGSAVGNSERYAAEAARLATSIASRGDAIVYGGGGVGLMGVVANAALDAGGEVIGVMPQVLVDGEILLKRLEKFEVVADMPARKARMVALGDAFIALPGGSGTLEELFEVWTWQQLGIHGKAVVLYDVDGFWQPLVAMLEQMVATGFIKQSFIDALIVVSDPDALYAALDAFVAPAPKWGK